MTLEELIIDCEKHESYSKAMFENNKHLFNEREKDYLKSVHRIHARYLEDLKKLTLPQVSERFLKELAHEHINKCKDMVYKPSGRNAGNEIEGDYGTWRDWEARLLLFARELLKYGR